MGTNEWVTDAEGDRITADKLTADLRMLGNDMEQLLKATTHQSGRHFAQVRARAEDSLKAARERIVELQDLALAKTRAAGQATDDYVRANPWQIIGVAAVAGLLVGYFLRRGGGTDS